MKFFHATVVLLLALSGFSWSQGPPSARGALVIAGGGGLSTDVIGAFVKLAGGDKARLVVIPTASARADNAPHSRYVDSWTQRGMGHVAVVHTRSRERADEEEFSEPIRNATAVWFGGGQQSRIVSAYRGTVVHLELEALLARGGVIGGTSAGAAVMSDVMIAGGNPVPRISRGFGFLPGAIVDQHFTRRKRTPRLVRATSDHPGLFGLGIDEGTAVVVEKGRNVRVVGGSAAVVVLSASENRPVRQIRLGAGGRADLVALQRAARARAAKEHPGQKPVTPRVAVGKLVIVGGGRLTPEIVRRFVAASGGPKSRIVVVPTAALGVRPQGEKEPGIAGALRRQGAGHVSVFHMPRLGEQDNDTWRKSLETATGIWFTGGRQWRLVDAYMETPALEMFRDVLRRGGAIGGSSAGATIQGDYLVRGSPLGNRLMMAEGYEKGFAFLPGVAIDQHFSQRNRFRDMSSVVKAFPQVLGLGIDEETAIVVEGTTFEVIGRHGVAVYDAGKKTKGDTDYDRLEPGTMYDLKRRCRLNE